VTRSGRDLAEQALALHQAGRLKDAAPLYDRALAQRPRDAGLLALAGALQSQLGKQTLAVKLLHRALAARPDHAEARHNLGAALMKLERHAEAAEAFAAATRLTPEQPGAWLGLGQALRAQGKAEPAIAAFRQVLALLPGALPGSLERVDSGLNAPFRERAGRADPAAWLPWRHPALWLAGLLLVAAIAFVLVPSQPGQLPALPMLDVAPAPVMPPSGAGGPTAAAAAAPTPANAASAVVIGTGPAAVPVASLPSAAAASGPSAPLPAMVAASSAADAALVLRAVQATWVQAVDGGGQTLMARLVPAGETVALTPALPVRLRIGNAQGTELLFRGQPVNLSNAARDNIANITLP
jgi:cytoskeleton protein RodZ